MAVLAAWREIVVAGGERSNGLRVPLLSPVRKRRLDVVNHAPTMRQCPTTSAGAAGTLHMVTLVRAGANSMQVFGNGTDTVDDVATATGVPQMPDSTTLYYCMTPGNWYTEGLASGYVRGGVGSFQTMSVPTGIVAHAGGGQANAVQLTAMNCFIATVATAGDSVKLPVSRPGMEITVINQSATATGPNVFPASGETINALSANTAIAVAPHTTLIFFCGVAGSWWTK